MSDISTTFKSVGETAPAPEPEAIKVKTDPNGERSQNTDSIEPPLSSYQEFNKHPFVADYFKISDGWQEFDELPVIEQFLVSQASQGKMENSPKAAGIKLKQLEKVIGIDPTERQIVKLGKIAAYIKFLKETEGIERNSRKYGI